MTCRQGTAGPGVITELEIEGFRGFSHVELKDLRRVNVIVGDSGSGKTSLLESVALLGAGTGSALVSFYEWRTKLSMNQESRLPAEAMALELFHDGTGEIKISCGATDGESRSIEVSQFDTFDRTQIYDTRPTRYLPFKVIWRGIGTDGLSKELVLQPVLQNNSLQYLPYPNTPDSRFVEYFPGSMTTVYLSDRQPAFELATAFNDLKATGRIDSILSSVTQEFGIAEITHGQDFLGRPILLGREQDKTLWFPLHTMSSGLVNTLRYFMWMNFAAKSVLLLDELENGIYYGRQEFLWSNLRKYAEDRGNQMFITTHSGECLESAAKVAKEHPDDFCLIRTTKEGVYCTAESFTGKQFVSSVERGFEVR